jgi:hypothetical protein
MAVCVLLLGAIQDLELWARLLDGREVPKKEILGLAPSPEARALAAIAWNLRAGAWPLEKSDVEIARRYLKERDLVRLLNEIRRLPEGAPLRIARTLALAGLEETRESPDLGPLAGPLSLVRDEEGRWIASEGRIVSRLRAGQFDGAVPPEWAYLQGVEILRVALGTETGLAEGLTRAAKAFRAVSGPMKKNADDLRSILDRHKFCKNCGGTASRPCDYGPCESGKIVKCCATCNGTGKNPQSYHAPNFQTPCPNPGHNGRHKWVEDCPRCRGRAAMPCRNCKVPWKPPAASDLFQAEPCPFCLETGWALARMKLPCAECSGVGSLLAPPKGR